MKKLISIVIVSIMLISVIPITFAAGISASETNTLNELKAGVKLNDKTIYIPDEYIKQAENYLVANEISDSSITKIMSDIAECKTIISGLDNSIVNTDGTLNFSKIPNNIKQSLVANITNACNEIDLIFTLSGSNVKIADKSGSTVFTGDVVIKNTGTKSYIPAVVITIAILLVIGYCVIYYKNNKAN